MRIAGLLATCLAFATAVAPANADEPGYKLLVLNGHSVKWQKPRSGGVTTLTYSFVHEAETLPSARNCGSLATFDQMLSRLAIPADRFRAETQAAFAMWEGVAALHFVEIADQHAADIVIGTQGVATGRAFTEIVLPEGHDARSVIRIASNRSGQLDVMPIQRAAVCLNPAQSWKIGFDGNLDSYDLRYTLAHEIGHTIGLDHPSSSGSLMGYRYDEHTSGLTEGDARGAIRLYGSRIETVAEPDVRVEARLRSPVEPMQPAH